MLNNFRRKPQRPKSKAVSSVGGGASVTYDEAYAIRESVDNVEDATLNNDKVEYNYIDNIPHQSHTDDKSDAARGFVSANTGSVHVYDYTSCSEIDGNETIHAETNVPMTSTYDSVQCTRQNPGFTDNEYSKFEEQNENSTYNSINTHSKLENKKAFTKTNENYSVLDVTKTTVKPGY